MTKRKQIIGIVVTLVLVVSSVFFLEGRKAKPADFNTQEKEAGENMSGTMAPEISTPDGFINTDEITIHGEIEKGNIVLVDYWTYSCINCQRTTPFLNDWHEKYGDKGLTIIGLHTPEFEFEKKYQNVVDAVERFDIKYPVVLDNDFSTWRAYENRYWPRKYLVDTDGMIVYDHIGEGGYEETEAKIVELLKKNGKLGKRFSADSLELETEEIEGAARSHETYLGYSRLKYQINPPKDESCIDAVCGYDLPGEIPAGAFALSGDWSIEKERNVTGDKDASLVIHFAGSEVNLVAEGSEGGAGADLVLDGEPLILGAGAHVADSQIVFTDSKLYNLIDLPESGFHTLEIKMKDKNQFAGYAFTFK